MPKKKETLAEEFTRLLTELAALHPAAARKIVDEMRDAVAAMKRSKTAPADVVALAVKIDALRTSDPARYRRVMRKLAAFEKQQRRAA
jgi:hypothetical protein